MAKKLGVTRPHIDRLCRSKRRPDLRLAFEIEDLTAGEVPARFWLTVKSHKKG
jgi:hypothetical protein